MRIPIEQLEADTLFNLVESFVLREGTDYGEMEIDLKDKVMQVIAQLKAGEAVLLYSELHETVNIIDQQTFLQQQEDPDNS